MAGCCAGGGPLLNWSWCAWSSAMPAGPAILVGLGLLLVGLASCPGGLTAEVPRATPRLVPQIPRDGWKDCFYNYQLVRCRDEQEADQLRIVWIDGLRTQLRRRPPARPGLPSYWGDRYGGLWRRELLPQGNILLTNLGTGNRILVPLRYPCKPPLKGEVGYCHE
ncbi:MAG: hypothetical protein ACKOZT_14390 [Cyanobium sp.]